MTCNSVSEDILFVNVVAGVYLIECLSNGKIYIGSSKDIEKRWKEHKRTLTQGNHHSPRLQHAWNLYGADNFHFSILAIISDEADRLTTEQLWLDSTNSSDREIGFNISKNAFDAITGIERTQEHNINIGLAHVGMKRSEEARNNMRDGSKKSGNSERMRLMNLARTGKPLSVEHRAKLSEQRTGVPKTEEHKRKIGDAHIRNALLRRKPIADLSTLDLDPE